MQTLQMQRRRTEKARSGGYPGRASPFLCGADDFEAASQRVGDPYKGVELRGGLFAFQPRDDGLGETGSLGQLPRILPSQARRSYATGAAALLLATHLSIATI